MAAPAQLKKRRRRRRRRRSPDASDIDTDIQSVYSRLIERQEDGPGLQLQEVIREMSGVMLQHIDQLKAQVEKIRFPQGTRESPALSCREIILGHPQYQSGWYWIDPSQGSADDAIQVWCNVTADYIETCVHPTSKTKMVAEKHWSKPQGKARWFNRLKGASTIKYGSSIQLGLLRLLSEEATQRFTYYCSGSVAWYDESTGSYDKAIVLGGDNDYEFETSTFLPEQILSDGCQGRGQGGSTIFEIKTDKLDRLPITNFMPMDYGDPWQKFGYEAGPICFH